MLYKKFCIEVFFNSSVVSGVELKTNSLSDNISIKLQKSYDFMSNVYFMSSDGSYSIYPFYYNSYNEAFNNLNKNYNKLLSLTTYMSAKITEHYNNIEPPLKYLRYEKLKKLKK